MLMLKQIETWCMQATEDRKQGLLTQDSGSYDWISGLLGQQRKGSTTDEHNCGDFCDYRPGDRIEDADRQRRRIQRLEQHLSQLLEAQRTGGIRSTIDSQSSGSSESEEDLDLNTIYCDEDFIEVAYNNPVLGQLDRAIASQFIDAMTPVRFGSGALIFEKGQQGDVSYIILDGQVKVHNSGLGDSLQHDQFLREGDWLGEWSLATGQGTRIASATAVTPIRALAIDRATYENTAAPVQHLLERSSLRSVLKGVPLFSAGSLVTSDELDQLVDRMQQVSYVEGQSLAEPGIPFNSNLWIFEQGRVLVYSQESGDMYSLESGDYFGDMFVAGKIGGTSTVSAVCQQKVTAWVLSRADLESVVGDLSRLGHFGQLVKTPQSPDIRMRDLNHKRIIGTGAFGKVWLVNHAETKKSYALKQMEKRHFLKPTKAKGVMQEKEFLRQLKHPFIVDLVASYQDEDNLYLLLPLIQGGELFSVLSRQYERTGGGLPDNAAAFYASNVIQALGHMHQSHIAYRDLKLENILIDSDGYCKLVDLGFAKVVTERTFSMVGTPEYLAPEVITREGHDTAVDMWSFGVLVYELLVGYTPFSSYRGNRMDMYRRIVRGRYTFPKTMGLAAKLLIRRLLASRPVNRLEAQQVVGQPWFKDAKINMTEILEKEAVAPWIPKVSDELDASNFDDYADSSESSSSTDCSVLEPLTRRQQLLFEGF